MSTAINTMTPTTPIVSGTFDKWCWWSYKYKSWSSSWWNLWSLGFSVCMCFLWLSWISLSFSFSWRPYFLCGVFVLFSYMFSIICCRLFTRRNFGKGMLSSDFIYVLFCLPFYKWGAVSSPYFGIVFFLETLGYLPLPRLIFSDSSYWIIITFGYFGV